MVLKIVYATLTENSFLFLRRNIHLWYKVVALFSAAEEFAYNISTVYAFQCKVVGRIDTIQRDLRVKGFAQRKLTEVIFQDFFLIFAFFRLHS